MYLKEKKIEMEAKIERYSEVNFLGPKQKKALLKLDFPSCYLEDKLWESLEKPDIKHLKKIFMPSRTTSKRQNDISDIDVFKAVAAGDIIGSVYEFTEHDYNNINADDLVQTRSCFTDDTVLSFATLLAVTDCPKKPNFRKAYIQAYYDFLNAGYGAHFIQWASGYKTSNKVGYKSYANGSAMRVAVIGSRYDDVKDVIDKAIKSALVTHNHQDGIKGAVVTAVVVWMAKNRFSKEEIKEYVSHFYHFDEESWKYVINRESYFDIDTDLSTVSNEIAKTSIFCNYAVPFAIKCFIETHSYKECMAEILKHYGDTDTICAIAGGICFAYYENINLSANDMRRITNILHGFTCQL